MAKRKRQETDIPASLRHIDINALLRSRGVYLRQQHNKALKDAIKPILTAQIRHNHKHIESTVITKDVAYAPPENSRLTSEQIMDYYSKQIHSIDVVTEHFNHAIVKYLTYVNGRVIDKLEAEVAAQKSIKAQKKAIENFETKDVFDDNEDAFLSQAQLDFTPLLDNLGVIAGQEALKLIDVNDPYLLNAKIKAKIAANVDKFTKSMLETDRQHIIDIIADGVNQGQSLTQIRDALTSDEVLSFTKMQSTRITATEVLRTSTQSALDAWEQSGVVEGKQWITAGATDECADYEGQIEILSGNFYDDISDFADGDPPLHPNCKCALIPIVVGSEEKMVTLDRKAFRNRIKELEDLVDKRTRAFKQIQEEKADDKAYIRALEGIIDGSTESPE